MISDSIHAYEAAKKAWCAANPSATPTEYERAMQELAERFGI